MKSPQMVNVVPQDQLSIEKISQYFVQVDARSRPRALRMLLQQRKPALAIVFCRTKRGAERVGMHLKADGFKAKTLHGDLTQRQRDEVMKAFREGKLCVLVATDIASRGLDVFDVSCVINYDLPQDHLTYVHRIGRTGRMGANGEAISFVFPDQVGLIREWVAAIGAKIEELAIEGLSPKEQDSSKALPIKGHLHSKGRQENGRKATKESQDLQAVQVSPITIKRIKERPLKAAKTEVRSRGHSYVGRQS
jgi:ATP-dependent RNA helicase DeaD